MNIGWRNYLDELRFFKTSLSHIFLVLSIFSLLTMGMSYDYYSRHSQNIRPRITNLQKYVQEHDLNTKEKANKCGKLFLNNVEASLQAIILGFIPFLFLSAVAVIVFSYPAGLLIAANEIQGMQSNLGFLLQRVAPHGVFEFAAIIYTSSIGIYITIQISRKFIPKYRRDALRFGRICKQATHSFLLIVIPLLLIAALVETFITPK